MAIISAPKIYRPSETREPPVASTVGQVIANRPRTTVRPFGACDVVRLGSFFLICMGLTTLGAWRFQWRAFLQFLPGTPFITCDTALGFILGGLGLLAASQGALRLCRLLGALLSIFGAVYLVAALRDASFSIHAFFPDLTSALTFPVPAGAVRMAGATAVALVLLGIFLILLGRTRPSRTLLTLAMFLASAVPSIGFLGTLTSVTGIAYQQTWISFLAKMALPTAIAVCLAGLSMGALCWMKTEGTGHRFQTAAASFTLIGLMLLFAGLSLLVVTNNDLDIQAAREPITASHQIILIQDIVASVRKAEASTRGFLLTRSESYLLDYGSALRLIRADLRTFRSYPSGGRQADALRALINLKLAVLSSIVSLDRNHETEKALAVIKSGKGFSLMAQIDAESAKLIRALEDERVQRRESRDETLRITRKTVLISYGIAFVMIFVALGVLRAEIGRRASVESELRKRTPEISERTAQLEAANRELEEFAYAASHDLKSPLRAIHNSARWLEEDLAEHLTGETREHLAMLRNRADRMEKLLDDLLEYARIGRAADNRYAETIRGDLLMEDVLALVCIPGFTVEVSPSFADIEVCRMPLQQILMNLIGNAIKHHHNKTGRIAVTVSNHGDFYDFAVKDDGPGIGDQFHARIFEMFRTLKPRDQVEGSGIGLAMVRKHIEVSGGTIQLESAVGKGSTFRFTSPKSSNGEKKSNESANT